MEGLSSVSVHRHGGKCYRRSRDGEFRVKVVIFEARPSDVCDFLLNGAVVERLESYKYLGFVFHATRKLTFGTDALVATARKALFAMRRRCALLGIRDPALQCKLFDTLVLPILSYGCEVWGVDDKCSIAAEVLHRGFLKHLLGVRKSTANAMVLAELGRFPLQIHFWQQILRYHHRTIALDNTRLVKLAMVDGFTLDTTQSSQTAAKDNWQYHLGVFLHEHTGQQQLFHQFDIAFIVERAKHKHAFQYFTDVEHSSLVLYRTLQPEYRYADYLSTVKCLSNRRLLSRFRSGCHGLRVDTGRWADNAHIDRADRLCLVCKSLDYVQDEQHFAFDCPAYNHIRAKHVNLFQHSYTVASFMFMCEPNACGGFLRECFACRKNILTV